MRDRNLRLLRALIREELARTAIEEGLWDDIKAAGSKVIGKLRGEPKGKEGSQQTIMRKREIPDTGASGKKKIESLSDALSELKNAASKEKIQAAYDFYNRYSTLTDPHTSMQQSKLDLIGMIKSTARAVTLALRNYDEQRGLYQKIDGEEKVKNALGTFKTSKIYEGEEGRSVVYSDPNTLSKDDILLIDAVADVGRNVEKLISHEFFKDVGKRNVGENLVEKAKKFGPAYKNFVEEMTGLLSPIETIISILNKPRAATKTASQRALQRSMRR